MNNLSNLEDQIEKELGELQQIQNLLSRFSKQDADKMSEEDVLKIAKFDENVIENLDMSLSSEKDSILYTPSKMVSKPMKKRTMKKRKTPVSKNDKVKRRKTTQKSVGERTPKLRKNVDPGYFKGVPSNTMKRSKRRKRGAGQKENVAPFNASKSIKRRKKRKTVYEGDKLGTSQEEMIDPQEYKRKGNSRVKRRGKSRSSKLITPCKELLTNL